MGKRPPRGPVEGLNPRKRLKITHEAPTSEDIHTSRQLRQLLTVDQDLKKARHGLQSFKVFLDRIVVGEDDQDEPQSILRQYLESSKPDGTDDDQIYLPDIMKIWDIAGQANNDNVMSAVPVVLGLLIRLLSQSLDSLPYALGICRTLLQKRQLELIARNLSADKGKEFIISPTLRMLREAICLDGGALVKPFFRARTNTFKSLARNMGLKYLGEGIEDSSRTSGRTNAIRFLLSALKFLHPEGKKELLLQKDITAALTRTIKDDPPYLVLEILNTLRQHVILDDKLPRDVKHRLLNSTTLTQIAGLYHYQHEPMADHSQAPVAETAHAFLTLACTVPSSGILRQDTGFYPRGMDEEEPPLLDAGAAEDLTLDSLGWADNFRNEVPVRNVILSDFITYLRPWSDLKQSELLISIFQVAPELLADYFIVMKKRSFTFEPKLSATWIGYAAFLFNVVQLSIPDYFGRQGGYSWTPPPTSIVIGNLLPLPLNQKVLARCLAHKSDLVPFFASRLLVAAMEKLQRALQLHEEASTASNSTIWAEAARRLVDEFCQRIPEFKDIITSYRTIAEDDLLHRESASRLLRLYYEVIPQVALTAKFDVSPLLIKLITRLTQAPKAISKDSVLALKELENLLVVAGYSPGMRWFVKSGELSFSPFVALLKLLVEAPVGVRLPSLEGVLDSVAREFQLVLPQPGRLALAPLLDALLLLKQKVSGLPSPAIWNFLDSCASRCASNPVKYIEMMQSETSNSGSSTVSLILLTMVEQLPFLVQSTEADALDHAAQFLPAFVGLLRQGGEDPEALQTILGKMKDVFSETPKAGLWKKASKNLLRSSLGSQAEHLTNSSNQSRNVVTTNGRLESADDLLALLSSGSVDWEVDTSSLTRWASKTIDELVDEGYLASLITLLASEHISIRKEALTNILKVAQRVRESEYDEKDQVWLLLQELAESAREEVDKSPLASPAVAFALHALDVVKQPLHHLYSKINAFLSRGPTWNVHRVPLFSDILNKEPAADDAYYAELSWLATFLLDGLRTPADLVLYHNDRVFEGLLSLASNPYMRSALRREMLTVIYRASCIEGGSSTLIKRFSIVGWLEAQSASDGEGADTAVYGALVKRIWATCDQEDISKWSGGGVLEHVLDRRHLDD